MIYFFLILSSSPVISVSEFIGGRVYNGCSKLCLFLERFGVVYTGVCEGITNWQGLLARELGARAVQYIRSLPGVFALGLFFGFIDL